MCVGLSDNAVVLILQDKNKTLVSYQLSGTHLFLPSITTAPPCCLRTMCIIMNKAWTISRRYPCSTPSPSTVAVGRATQRRSCLCSRPSPTYRWRPERGPPLWPARQSSDAGLWTGSHGRSLNSTEAWRPEEHRQLSPITDYSFWFIHRGCKLWQNVFMILRMIMFYIPEVIIQAKPVSSWWIWGLRCHPSLCR